MAYIIQNYWKLLLSGLGTTVLLAVVGTGAGFLLSLLIVILRTQKIDKKRDCWIIRVLKTVGNWFAVVYITIFRGTPMMVQALILFYGLSPLGLVWWTPLMAGLTVITLNTTAYIAEVIRGSVNAIDKGQMEAGRSLGFSHLKTMFLIIYPQAIRNSLPAIGNELIVNLKDSSVLNVIMVTELFKIGQEIQGKTFDTVSVYVIVATLYLVLTLLTSLLVRYLERRQGFRKEKFKSQMAVA